MSSVGDEISSEALQPTGTGRLETKVGVIRDLVYLPTGQHIAVVYESLKEFTIEVMAVKSLEVLRKISFEANPFRWLFTSPNGRLITVKAEASEVFVHNFDLLTGSEGQELRLSGWPTDKTRFHSVSSNGQYLIGSLEKVTSWDMIIYFLSQAQREPVPKTTIRVVDILSGQTVFELEQRGTTHPLTLAPNVPYLVFSTMEDQLIHVVQTGDGREVDTWRDYVRTQTSPHSRHGCYLLSAAAEGHLLVTAGATGWIIARDLRTGIKAWSTTVHPERLSGVCVSRDGQLIAVQEPDLVAIWKLGIEKPKWIHTSGRVQAAFSPSGETIAILDLGDIHLHGETMTAIGGGRIRFYQHML